VRTAISIGLTLFAVAQPAAAAPQISPYIDSLRQELETLRTEQAKPSAKIDAVEAALNALAGAKTSATSGTVTENAIPTSQQRHYKRPCRYPR
jgi:hypothetical protein